MKFQIDTKYLVDFFRHIVSVPSPTEFYVRLNPVLKQYAEELGCEMTLDRRKAKAAPVACDSPLGAFHMLSL